jgi:hypothetical protein
MNDVRAYVSAQPWRDGASLVLVWGSRVYKADGGWHEFDPAMELDMDELPRVPTLFLKPLRDALDEYLGVSPHKGVEAVLRETLQVERERVNSVLYR